MLCVAGGKGGSGKTTAVVGLGRALVRQGHRPLLVEGDIDMPDLPQRLGVAPDPNLERVAEGTPVEVAAQSPDRHPGLAVLTGRGTEALAPALRRLDGWCGPVIVDSAGGANPDVAAALQAADRSLLVSLATPASLEDTAKTAAMSRELDTPVAGVVLRAPPDGGPSTGRSQTAGVAALLDAPVLADLPHVEDTVQTDPRIEAGFRAASVSLSGGPALTAGETGPGPGERRFPPGDDDRGRVDRK